MAEIMRLLGQACVSGPARQLDPPLRGLQEPRNQAQKRGFSSAIVAGHHQGLARVRGETQPGEDLAPATDTGQITSRQAASARPRSGGPAMTLRQIRTNPLT